ncbi:putative nitric oxide dioxygenase [Emiliania huxleyi CCMP1516]|uniref:nitric oxide dioxygenase n=2 Tax=Emiliania huxleyi TaxID=2903 RepID=A0A0D3JQL5_EMIH1|nr:putative nitric oxide dioxygenase [Emiliania huxleyi CCMP1516]EOD25800.1 putative nitric oxide dioxygenase [Emiliania huxleyi CCMP1516]|eukprot:XP_005778229.1 putative nitric oxide dioxygenase [Emiliania huxleyi CCMP1516]
MGKGGEGARKCPFDGDAAKKGLPSGMSAETIATVDATAGAVAPFALDITKDFYGDMIASLPSVVLTVFNPAHNVPISTHQPEALAASVCAYATNIKDLSPLLVPGGAVDAINHRHCALNIQPAHYLPVHDHLMGSIAHVLGPKLGDALTPEVAGAWSEAVRFLAKVCIDKEEALYAEYEKRPGGWRGLKDFTVTEIADVATGIKSFKFEPVNPLTSGFAFEAGQYLTVKVDPNGDGLTAPRHYTATSPPGAKYLQCTTKKVAGGVVSTYMHETLKVGDTVKLTPPYGVFTLDDAAPTAVLLSAGIGVTPMINFARALGGKVALAVHVDKSAKAHALKGEFESLLGKKKLLCKYTDGGKRPSAASVAAETISKAGTEHVFYICGPPAWMSEMQAELLKLGAKKVMCEVFGSQLATSCPFAASPPKAEDNSPGAAIEGMLARTVGPSLARTFTEAMPSGGGAKVAVGACAVAAVAAIAFKALR